PSDLRVAAPAPTCPAEIATCAGKLVEIGHGVIELDAAGADGIDDGKPVGRLRALEANAVVTAQSSQLLQRSIRKCARDADISRQQTNERARTVVHRDQPGEWLRKLYRYLRQPRGTSNDRSRNGAG